MEPNHCPTFFSSTIKYNAVFYLTRITQKSPPKTMKLIAKSDAVPKFVNLILSSDPNVATSSLIFLDKIINGSPDLRKYFDELQIVKQLRKVVDSSESKKVLESAVATLISLCESKESRLEEKTVKELLETVLKFANHSNSQVAETAALGLPLLLRSENIQNKNVFDNEKIISTLIQLLRHRLEQTRKFALVAIGKIIHEENEEFMSEIGILKFLPQFLHSDDERIVKLALRIIGQVSTTSEGGVDILLEASLISPLIQLLCYQSF